MDLQTWVSLAAVAGFGLAILASLRSFRQDFETRLGDQRDELKGDMTSLRSELKGAMTSLRSELKGDMTGLRHEFTGLRDEFTGLRHDFTGLRHEFADLRDAALPALRDELKSDLADFRAETRAGFSEVNRRLAVLEDRTYDLASRLPPPPARSVSGT